jgi:hypothetical protein
MLLTEGDAAGSAQALARKKLAAAICKRLQGLLQSMKVLVNTVLAMPSVLDQQVRRSFRAWDSLAMSCSNHGRLNYFITS